MTIAEFILARVADDEGRVEGIRQGSGDPDFALGPDRIRAECQAKRRLVAEHFDPRWPTFCQVCAWGVGHLDSEHVEHPCNTLRVLAAVHAGHADYDPAWAVDLTPETDR